MTLSSTGLKSTMAYFKVLFKAGNAFSRVTVAHIVSPGNKGSFLGWCGIFFSPQSNQSGSGTHPALSPVGTGCFPPICRVEG